MQDPLSPVLLSGTTRRSTGLPCWSVLVRVRCFERLTTSPLPALGHRLWLTNSRQACEGIYEVARQRDPDDTPRWLSMIRQPGVIEVLASLANHGPHTYAALCAYVEVRGETRRTAQAVRRLAAWRMCRKSVAGSWDNIVQDAKIGAVFELTDRGHDFAQALALGGKLVEQLPPTFLRTLRRYT